jgi:hypothetical protein
MFSGQCRDCVDVSAGTDDETETDDTEWTNCDECLDSVTCADYDANDGLCAQCLAKTFVCEECEERTSQSDAHKTHTTLCEGCGDSKAEELATEALDAAKEALQELVDELVGLDDIDVLKRTIKALKRLQR